MNNTAQEVEIALAQTKHVEIALDNGKMKLPGGLLTKRRKMNEDGDLMAGGYESAGEEGTLTGKKIFQTNGTTTNKKSQKKMIEKFVMTASKKIDGVGMIPSEVNSTPRRSERKKD